jgi:Tol biopolymer transport system component
VTRVAPLAALLLLGLSVAPGAQQVGGVSQLVWFDRAGGRLGEVGGFGDIGNIELSPDGSRVAVALTDAVEGTRDLWFYETETGARTRFTSSPADENWLVWAPGGERVAYNAFSASGLDLYVAAAGGGAPQLLLRDGDGKWPVSWSPDGRRLLMVTNSLQTGNDIWVLPLDGGTPEPLLQSALAENWAAFSPDGRWIAYSSSDTGTSEVYVMPYPATGQRWQVSSGGGTAARWRDDGRELYFVAPDRWLIATAVEGAGDAFTVGARARLFETRYPYPPFHSFDVAAGGERFLVNTAVAAPVAPGLSARLLALPWAWTTPLGP